MHCLRQVRGALCSLEVAQVCLVSLIVTKRGGRPLRLFEAKFGGTSFRVTRFHATIIFERWVDVALRSYALLTCYLILGRSQVVRHRSLEPAFVGSNPPAPAKNAGSKD